jgi:hypothetical protein
MIHTHQTAPTQFVEANGIRLGYRRFDRANRRRVQRQVHGEQAGPERQFLPHSRWPCAFHLSQLLPTGCALGLQWRAARTRRRAVTIARHR